MIRWTYFMLLALLLACAAAPAHAQQIVVLTEEPVAEFRLPDGSVLKNAYVWRRTYDGLLIIHDGGQYFLNYKTLPPEWQAAYTGYDGSAEETVSSTPAETVEEPTGDRYRIGEVLDHVPALAPETREKLLERGAGEEFDQAALVIALLQAVLDEEREAANRCILYLEERGYEVDEVARDTLFETCPVCRGDGTVTRKCRVCRGTGDCTKCVDPVTTMGKRSSREEQSMTELGKRSGQDHDCELCEGSGKCAKCSGDGEIEAACARCRGAGKVVARMYCEIVRDKWVRNLNARVSGSPPASIMASPTVDFMTTLAELPGLNTNALGY